MPSENRVNTRLYSEIGRRLEPQLHMFVPAAQQPPEEFHLQVFLSGRLGGDMVIVKGSDSQLDGMGEVDRNHFRVGPLTT
jgi:hypothetical protein